MDIRQQHQSTLDIDYIRDESLTLKVSDLELKNNKNYQIWRFVGIILTILCITLLSLIFNYFLFEFNITTFIILLIITLVGSTIYAIRKAMSLYQSMPYTFNSITFQPTEIIIDETKYEMQPPFMFSLFLNQAKNRPTISLENFDSEIVYFQLDSLQDFPIITDAIAAVYGLSFCNQEDILTDDFEEILYFYSALQTPNNSIIEIQDKEISLYIESQALGFQMNFDWIKETLIYRYNGQTDKLFSIPTLEEMNFTLDSKDEFSGDLQTLFIEIIGSQGEVEDGFSIDSYSSMEIYQAIRNLVELLKSKSELSDIPIIFVGDTV